MASNEPFFLSQAAKILEMPQTTVKNWTIGKPLRIDPHRSAVGSGFPNLYGIHDLYRFSIAKRLSMDGLAPRAIQSILDGLGADFTSSEFAIVTSGDGHHPRRSKRTNLQVQGFSQSQFDREGWSVARSSFGCHVLNILGITEDVNQRVDKFMQKPFGKRRTPNPGQQQLSAPTDVDQLEGDKVLKPGRKFRLQK
jgi:hypothetical protein